MTLSQKLCETLLFFLPFSCASVHRQLHSQNVVLHRSSYSCVEYHRDNVTVPLTQLSECAHVEHSRGSITLHRGDVGTGLYDTPWWCSKWFVEVVMNSRGFCNVQWIGDKELRASYCGDVQTFLAPTRLSWVIVKSEHEVDGNIK